MSTPTTPTTTAAEGQRIQLPALNVLFFKEEGFWVAQCLEFDVTAQGRTIPEARMSFERVLVAQVLCDLKEKRAPLSLIPSAPSHFWRKYRKASALHEREPIPLPEELLPRETPPAWMIPYLTVNELRVM
jgi:hypothetical protein